MKKKVRRLLVVLLTVMTLLPALPAMAGTHWTLPDEELSSYAAAVRPLSLVTNDGQAMTYDDAVKKICDAVQTRAQKANPALTAEQIAALRALVAKRLWLQQYGCDLRCVGDHGVRHIYGNIERALHFLKDFPAREQLAATVCHLYHDVGYTNPDILFGVPDETGEIAYASKFDHDTRSWDYFETTDRPFWQSLGVFSDADFDAMQTAVSLHNTDAENYAKHIGKPSLTDEERKAVETKLLKCLDANVSPIVAAVHLGDKLALSQREKMPLTIDRTPEIIGYLTDAYGVQLMKKAVAKETELELAERLRALAAEAAENGAGRAYFHAEAFNERDMKLSSGKRFLPMNFVQTDGDCLSLRETGGVRCAYITLKVLDYDEGVKLLGEKLAGRQLQKFFGDVGIRDEEAAWGYIRKAFEKGGVELPGAHVVVEIQKEPMAANDERQAARRAVANAVNGSPVYRIGRAYRELRDACKAGDASDLTVWKMRSLLEEVGGTDEKRAERFEEQAAPPVGQRDAEALLKAFDKCLKHSDLPDMILALWTGTPEEGRSAA